MPVTISFRVDERQVRAALARFGPAAIGRRLDAAMGESTEYLKGEVQRRTPVNEGTSRASVFAEHRGRTFDGIRGVVGSPLAHMPVLEEGRRAGAAPPPVAVIQKWARRKLGDGSVGTAYVIARAIGRRGTKAHHMFRDAARSGEGVVRAIFMRALGGL